MDFKNTKIRVFMLILLLKFMDLAYAATLCKLEFTTALINSTP